MSLAVLVAAIVEATAGFGATIVTVTLAAQLMSVHEILAIFLPVNLAMSLYLLIRYRALVAWDLLGRRVLPWMGAGLIVGILSASAAGQPLLKALFAALVVLLAAWELARPGGNHAAEPRPISPTRAAGALLAAGVVHGVFATGGPLVVYVLGKTVAQKGQFRATLAALWTVLNSTLILSYVRQGYLDTSTLQVSALMLVPLLVGGALGERLHHRLPLRQFRIGVFALLLAGGLSLLIRTLAA